MFCVCYVLDVSTVLLFFVRSAHCCNKPFFFSCAPRVVTIGVLFCLRSVRSNLFWFRAPRVVTISVCLLFVPVVVVVVVVVVGPERVGPGRRRSVPSV